MVARGRQFIVARNDGVKITFNADACNWDLKIVYDDDSTAIWSNVNLCKIEN